MIQTCRLLSTNQNVTNVEIEKLTEKSTKIFSQLKSQDLGKLTFELTFFCASRSTPNRL